MSELRPTAVEVIGNTLHQLNIISATVTAAEVLAKLELHGFTVERKLPHVLVAPEQYEDKAREKLAEAYDSYAHPTPTGLMRQYDDKARWKQATLLDEAQVWATLALVHATKEKH